MIFVPNCQHLKGGWCTLCMRKLFLEHKELKKRMLEIEEVKEENGRLYWDNCGIYLDGEGYPQEKE